MTSSAGVAAIVLAGGRSTRMGRDKAHVVIDGEPLVTRVCRAVTAACDPVVLVAAPDQGLPDLPGVRTVHDAVSFEGPLRGAWTGLSALAPTDAGRALLTGVDAVCITPELIRALARLGDGSVAVADGDRLHLLPVMVALPEARRAAARLLAAGELRLRALVEALAPRVVSRAELLADGELRRVDPELLGLEDADDPAALARLTRAGA